MLSKEFEGLAGRRLACLAAGLLLFANGCGSGGSLPLVPVTGSVTYQGKPLSHGTVVFSPDGGTPGPQASGAIKSNGLFRMQTLGRDGAAVGRHLVMVHCRRQVTPEEARRLVVGESQIPEKYGQEDSTPLTFEVKEGKNEYPIDLE